MVRSRVQWVRAFVHIHSSALRGVNELINKIELQHRITRITGISERRIERRGDLLQGDGMAMPSVRGPSLQVFNMRNKDPGSRPLIALRQL